MLDFLALVLAIVSIIVAGVFNNKSIAWFPYIRIEYIACALDLLSMFLSRKSKTMISKIVYCLALAFLLVIISVTFLLPFLLGLANHQ